MLFQRIFNVMENYNTTLRKEGHKTAYAYIYIHICNKVLNMHLYIFKNTLKENLEENNTELK